MSENGIEKGIQKEFNTVKDSEKNLDEMPFKEYQIKGNDEQLYNLKIFQSNKFILFLIKDLLDFRATKFQKEIQLEEFYNLNRFFRQYLSLEELFSLFFQNLKNSEISINKNGNKINLFFIVDCRGIEEQFPFILEPEQSTIENMIDNLNEKLKEKDNQNKFNQNILKELKDFKKKINNNKEFKINHNDYKSFFSILNMFKLNKISIIILLFCLFVEWIINKNLKNEIKFLKNEVQHLIGKSLFSRIIGKDELYLLEEEIKDKYNKKVNKSELLFRASEDGYSSSDFHNKCDGESNTITFVKTTDGRRIGGYNNMAWTQNKSFNNNNNNFFVFDLNEKEIYYSQELNQNIYINRINDNLNYNNYGPIFEGEEGFKISNNYNAKKSYFNSMKIETENTYNNRRKVNNIKKDNSFYVREYEVYKIYFE